MRILLDARNMLPKMSGLGRYAYNLVQALAKYDHENEYIVLKRKANTVQIIEQDNFQEIAVSHDIASPRNTLWPTKVINKLNVDLYHSLYQFFPAQLKARSRIVTMHDMMWVENPRFSFKYPWTGQFIHMYANFLLPDSLRSADLIIAVSQHTKDRLIALYPDLKDKVTVVYHGVHQGDLDCEQESKQHLPEILKKEPFILSLGNTRPYKNIPRVLQAFSQVCNQNKKVRLVIAGRGDRISEIKALAKKLNIVDQVVFLGWVNDRIIRALYQHCQFLAFPSLIEGFGLPVLECMKFGSAVLTSNRPPMTELADDAAYLVDPENVSNIAKGMQILLKNDDLRKKLTKKGRQRVAEFTWERTAEQVFNTYEKIAQSKGILFKRAAQKKVALAKTSFAGRVAQSFI